MNAFKEPVGKKSLVEEIVLIPSGAGRFEVIADGRLIFSKAATGRHPTADEIIALIRKG